MGRFSTKTDDALRQAGWYPGRQVPDLVNSWRASLLASDGIEIFPSAERALLEFGGLEFHEQGPGESRSREPFTLDPTLCLYESDRFSELSPQVNTRLYPLGEAEGGLCFLAVGENGRIYFVMQDIELLAEDIDQALEKLIRGLLFEGKSGVSVT